MTQSRWIALVGLGISIACTACGSSVSSGNGGQGGSTSQTGSLSGTTSAADCASIVADEEGEGAPVTVRIINHTAADLYVQHSTAYSACWSGPPFEIKGPDGADLPHYSKAPCTSTCAKFTNTSTCTVTATCSDPPVTRIAPQGILTVSWDGVVLETRTVPVSCLGTNGSALPGMTAPCEAWIKPTTFPLSFTASANTSTTCAADGCTCVANASGTCTIDDYGQVAGSKVAATASLAQGATTLDIVFE